MYKPILTMIVAVLASSQLTAQEKKRNQRT